MPKKYENLYHCNNSILKSVSSKARALLIQSDKTDRFAFLWRIIWANQRPRCWWHCDLDGLKLVTIFRCSDQSLVSFHCWTHAHEYDNSYCMTHRYSHIYVEDAYSMAEYAKMQWKLRISFYDGKENLNYLYNRLRYFQIWIYKGKLVFRIHTPGNENITGHRRYDYTTYSLQFFKLAAKRLLLEKAVGKNFAMDCCKHWARIL